MDRRTSSTAAQPRSKATSKSLQQRPDLTATASTASRQPAPAKTHPAGSQTAPSLDALQQHEEQDSSLRCSSSTRPSNSSSNALSLSDDTGSMASIRTTASADDAGTGLDVLAALASLGINESVRATVQQALDQLEAAATSAGLSGSMQPAAAAAGAAAVMQQGADTGTTHSHVANSKRLEELEKKLGMSRSIMRKLYHKNVELEKELQVLKANSSTSPISFSISTAELQARQQSNRPQTSAGQANGSQAKLDSLVVQALQERDATVVQLHAALDAARRRCALLEGQLAMHGPQSVKPSQPAAHNVKDVLAQSHLHYSKYRQIRDDYTRLLNKRAGTLATGKAVSVVARTMVTDMRNRLQQEVTEREAEAALYSAKLYESERQMSDWYVERRLLEEHIAQLNAEITQRDHLDSEIESCMVGLLQSNEQMRQQLAGATA